MNMVEWWDNYGEYEYDPVYVLEYNFYDRYKNMVDWWEDEGKYFTISHYYI